MRFCQKCNMELDDTWLFCPSCGEELEVSDAELSRLENALKLGTKKETVSQKLSLFEFCVFLIAALSLIAVVVYFFYFQDMDFELNLFKIKMDTFFRQAQP